jgi:hypothetical protein
MLSKLMFPGYCFQIQYLYHIFIKHFSLGFGCELSQDVDATKKFFAFWFFLSNPKNLLQKWCELYMYTHICVCETNIVFV